MVLLSAFRQAPEILVSVSVIVRCGGFSGKLSNCKGKKLLSVQLCNLTNALYRGQETQFKLHVKPMCPQDGQLELSKDLSVEEEEILELKKEPFASDNVDPGLQKDVPKETSKGRVESENHKAVYENGERRLDCSVGREEHDKYFEEGTKECEELCEEREVGAEIKGVAYEDMKKLQKSSLPSLVLALKAHLQKPQTKSPRERLIAVMMYILP